MSKGKKTKVLASLLCATTLAGIYAAPVMAEGDVKASGDIHNAGTLQLNIGATTKDITNITIAGVTLNAGNISMDNKITAYGGLTAKQVVTSTVTGSGNTTQTALSGTAQNDVSKATSTVSTSGINNIFSVKEGTAYVQAGKVTVGATGAAIYGNAYTSVNTNKNGTVAIQANKGAGTVSIKGSNVVVGTDGSMTLKNGTTQLLNVSNTGNLTAKGSITANGSMTANGLITANSGLSSKKTISSSVVDTGASDTQTALSAIAQNNTTKAVSSNSTTGISDIFYKDGVQTGKVAVDASGAALYGTNSTYVKANQNGTIAINGSNVYVRTDGSMGLKKADGTLLFGVTNSGSITASGLTAKMGEVGATGTQTALSATAQNNTTKAVSTNSTTGISDVFYKDDAQTGKVAVDASGAGLYGANNTTTFVKANQNGTVSIKGSNVIVGTDGSMTLKNGTTQLLNVSSNGNLNVKGSITAGGTTIANNGAITANNGLTSSKTLDTSTGAGYGSASFQDTIEGYSGIGKDGQQTVQNYFSSTKYSNADDINGNVTAGSNIGYSNTSNGSKSTSTGKVTSDQNGLTVSSNKTTKSFTQTEAIAKTGTATGELASGTNSYGGTKDKLTVYNSATGETTTYTVKDTQTTITNSFKSTADDGLNYSKSNDTYQKLYVRKVNASGRETGKTTTEYSKIDQDNTMSQNNGSFSIIGSSQKDIASSSENMLDGKMSAGTKQPIL